MRAFSFLAVALMTLLKLSSTQASICPPGPPLFSPVINNGIVADVTVVRTVDSGPYAGSIEAHVSQVLFGEFSGQTLYFYPHSSGSSLDGCGPGLSSTPGTRSIIGLSPVFDRPVSPGPLAYQDYIDAPALRVEGNIVTGFISSLGCETDYGTCDRQQSQPLDQFERDQALFFSGLTQGIAAASRNPPRFNLQEGTLELKRVSLYRNASVPDRETPAGIITTTLQLLEGSNGVVMLQVLGLQPVAE